MTNNTTPYVRYFPHTSPLLSDLSSSSYFNSNSSVDDVHGSSKTSSSADDVVIDVRSSKASSSADDDESTETSGDDGSTETSNDDESTETSDDDESTNTSDSSSQSSFLPDISDVDHVQPSKIRKISRRDYSSSDASDDEEGVESYSTTRPNKDMRGQKVDLISYLSSRRRDFLVNMNGEKVSVKSSVQGKYVILIWLMLPVHSYTHAGYTCWALQSACSTSSNWSTNVQVVVVPRLRPGWEEEALYSFLSGLPSCLAIPLRDSNSVKKALYQGDPFRPHAIFFHPNQTVLQQGQFCCDSIIHFGADSYPFTDERLLTLRNTNLELMKEKPFPLERLLGLELSDCLSNVAGDAKTTVSELKQKLVGVFITFHFDSFDKVHKVYQDCLAKGRELEIVLACINLADDPQHHMQSVYAALRDNDKGKGILSSWWVLPYNDSTQRRLWKLCDYLNVGEDGRVEDFIIVGPHGEFFDPKALCAICFDPSIYDMYPYAIQVIAQQETARLQKLTLESLFDDSLLVTQQGNLMPVTKLRGKKVLLFVADLEDGYKEIMDQMRDCWCPEIKLKCKVSNIAVVFVPLHASDLIFTKDLDPKMFWLWDPTISWLISPPNYVREGLIIKALSLKGVGSTLPLSCVTFREDGQFVSSDLSDLSEYMADDFPANRLYYEVLEQYCNIFDHARVRWVVGY